MKATLRLPKTSSLHDEFNGKTGEVTYQGQFRAKVRIKLDGHTERNPSVAILLVPWEHVEVVG